MGPDLGDEMAWQGAHDQACHWKGRESYPGGQTAILVHPLDMISTQDIHKCLVDIAWYGIELCDIRVLDPISKDL